MLRNILLIVLLLGLFENISAQKNNEYNRFSVGMNFGIGINSTSKPINNEGIPDPGVSLNGGIAFLIPITPKEISLTPELNYSWYNFDDGEEDNTTYQINYIDIPIIFNIRLWGIEEFNGYRTINLEVGYGFGKPIHSKKQSLYSENKNEWIIEPVESFEIEVKTNPFEKPKPQKFVIFGINSRLTGNNIKTIGLRYTRMLTGLYENNPSVKSYNLDTKARCLSLELLFYF